MCTIFTIYFQGNRGSLISPTILISSLTSITTSNLYNLSLLQIHAPLLGLRPQPSKPFQAVYRPFEILIIELLACFASHLPIMFQFVLLKEIYNKRMI